MNVIFDIATRIATPLAAFGFIATVFFLILRELIKRGTVPSMTRKHSPQVVILIINKLFILSIVALILGFGGYVVSQFAPNGSSRSNANTSNTIYPVVDLSKPVENQIQLFPTDKVRLVAPPGSITEVWFGQYWEPFDVTREYLVWGISGQRVIPQFRGKGLVKLQITCVNNRSAKRYLSGRANDAQASK